MSYRIEKLNPLAFPKGQSLVCEMTGKPAMVSCVSDYITLHFASAEIAKQAWDGVLCRVAHVIGPILAPPALMGSEEERDRRQQAAHASKLALIATAVPATAALPASSTASPGPQPSTASTTAAPTASCTAPTCCRGQAPAAVAVASVLCQADAIWQCLAGMRPACRGGGWAQACPRTSRSLRVGSHSSKNGNASEKQ